MKLVETELQGPAEDATPPMPPRPEHRRVAVSALLTVFVLVGTVVTIYLVFPKRNNQLMTRAFAFHKSEGPYTLKKPQRDRLVVFSLGLLGSVPWPKGDLKIVGVTAGSILSFSAVMVRYEVGGRPVSLVVQRGRDTPPRRYHRSQGPYRGESWRVGKWTFVAIGPAEDPEDWLEAMGVP